MGLVYKYFVIVASFVVINGLCAWLLFRHIDPDHFGHPTTSLLNMLYLLTACMRRRFIAFLSYPHSSIPSAIHVSMCCVVVLYAAANFPDVTLTVVEGAWPSVLFFVVYLLMGILFLLALVLAVIYKHYTAQFKATLWAKVQRIDRSLRVAFDLLCVPHRTNTPQTQTQSGSGSGGKRWVEHHTWIQLCDAVRPGTACSAVLHSHHLSLTLVCGVMCVERRFFVHTRACAVVCDGHR
jgi:hypothetical protein